MTKTKPDEAAEEVTPPPGLLPRFICAVGGRLSGHSILGEMVTQDGPWKVTV